MRLIDADAFFNDFPEMRYYEYASQEYEIDATPVKHGQWYNEPNYLGTSLTMFFCSVCGSASYREDPYCWQCGSKMDEVKND